jgi:microcompartment protein CcmK/EutM
MNLCRVKGTVVATAKHPAFHARKLLIVQPLDENGGEKGESFIAVDMVQAGEGDVVLVNREGNGNRQILGMGDIVPIRSLVVGVVDAVTVEPAPAGKGAAR